MYVVRSLTILFLLLTPASALATWSIDGGREPDTVIDARGSYAWSDPDVSRLGARAYFNVVPSDRNTGLDFNPNSAVLGSRITPPGELSMRAWFGVWKDCNRDGYGGTIETALAEYPTATLSDPSVCPPGTSYNKNGWVSEFRPFANERGPTNSGAFPRSIVDSEARVWGDFGLPGVGRLDIYDCSLLLMRRGTLDSTGGLLRHVDCQTQYSIGNALAEADRSRGTAIGFDGSGGAYHPERDCDHLLNAPLNTYGRNQCNHDAGVIASNSGSPAFQVWDCTGTGGTAVEARDPTAPEGERGSLSSVSNPIKDGEIFLTGPDGIYGLDPSGTGRGVYLKGASKGALDPKPLAANGSYYDGINNARDGVGSCAGDPPEMGPGEAYLGANAERADPTDPKRASHFTFLPTNRYGVEGIDSSLPDDLGARGLRMAPWTATSSYGPLVPQMRGGDLKPVHPLWLTFYASLGPASLGQGIKTPAPAVSKYGAMACGSFTSGSHGGWDCDVDNWWNPDHGIAENPIGALPNWVYVLRDVDCYDGGLVDGLGVHASDVILTEQAPCGSL